MNAKWLIWSNEHSAWWAPNARGYVKSRSGAGRYTYEEAAEICEGANACLRDKDAPHETMLPDVSEK